MKLLNSNILNRCLGIIYADVPKNGVYSVKITENADYFLIASANAETVNVQPTLKIFVNGTLVKINSGGFSGSTTTYKSISLSKGDIVQFSFESVVANQLYNSYFVMRMKLNN